MAGVAFIWNLALGIATRCSAGFQFAPALLYGLVGMTEEDCDGKRLAEKPGIAV